MSKWKLVDRENQIYQLKQVTQPEQGIERLYTLIAIRKYDDNLERYYYTISCQYHNFDFHYCGTCIEDEINNSDFITIMEQICLEETIEQLILAKEMNEI